MKSSARRPRRSPAPARGPRAGRALAALATLAILAALAALTGLAGCGEEVVAEPRGSSLTLRDLAHAEKVLGLSFTPAQRRLMLEDAVEQRDEVLKLRQFALANSLPPALLFDPRPAGFRLEIPVRPPRWSEPAVLARPADLEELAFASVAELGSLLRRGEVTSLELTEMYLERLRRHDEELLMVVTLLEATAREQARRADREIAAGQWRGPLHGIPYGVKDLLAVAGTRTTWGAAPYREQVIDSTATVVQRLEAAGAVLVVKLSLGALAWGDIWFGGQTRNPWRLEQGSSGSSAGPAAAVAAGCVPFAIGSETWGSIVSPSTRCGTTGLRPTYGRVSRSGAMALSWSMDKLGPMTRSVEDCALVLEAIRGPDGRDRSVVAAPFPYAPEVDWSSLRVGYLVDLFEPPAAEPGEGAPADTAAAAAEERGRRLDLASLEVLRGLGAQLVPVGVREGIEVRWIENLPISCLELILSVEAAAAFQELTRSGRDAELSEQGRYAWPNVLRTTNLVPAVAYVQANRVREMLIEEMARVLGEVDLLVTPSLGGDVLLITNLTGHPCVVVPNGFTEPDQPHSISFVGRLYDEATILAVARAYQKAAGFGGRRPPAFDPAAKPAAPPA